MVGHLLQYHPGVNKLKEIAASGELGEIHYIYGNRLNLGQLRRDENALWSLGAHDVSVLLYLAEEEPFEWSARGESYMREGVEDVVFGFLRFPSGVAAHLHLSWLDPHKERRFTVVGLQADGDVRRHGPRAQGHRLRQGLRPEVRHLRRVHHPLGRHLVPARGQRRAPAPGVRALPGLRARRAHAGLRRRERAARGPRARGSAGVARREPARGRSRASGPSGRCCTRPPTRAASCSAATCTSATACSSEPASSSRRARGSARPRSSRRACCSARCRAWRAARRRRASRPGRCASASA